MNIDVHQHLWAPPLIEALRGRRTPPRLSGWTLELPGGPDYAVSPEDHDVDARAGQAADDELGLALVSLSSPLGIESLPPSEAGELIDAHHEGCAALPPPFRAWAAANVVEPDPAALINALDAGCVGLQLPATALQDTRSYAHLAELLRLLEDKQRPLLIHPGPAPSRAAPTPHWWPALVSYVQQMHAAWFAFRVDGRPRFPGLRVCFAMLAGSRPAARGALRGAGASEQPRRPRRLPRRLLLRNAGDRCHRARARHRRSRQRLRSSLRQPVAPDLGDAALHAMRSANPARLLDLEEVSHEPALATGAQPDPAELEALVNSLAGEPERWRGASRSPLVSASTSRSTATTTSNCG